MPRKRATFKLLSPVADATFDPKPRGKRADLEAALDAWGPFQFATIRDAARDVLSQKRSSISAVFLPEIDSREKAAQQIQKLAENYNRIRAFDARAPRVADIVDQLRDAQRQVRALRAGLSGLHEISRDVLHSMGRLWQVEVDSSPKHRKIYRTAICNALPLGNIRPAHKPMNTTWLNRLDALNAWFDESVASFIENFGSGDSARPDKGDQTNFFKLVGGPPNWRFIRQAYDLFYLYVPPPGLTRKRRHFGRFAKAVYQYATGNIDTHTLDAPMKQYVPLKRWHQRIVAEIDEIEREIIELANQHALKKITRSEQEKATAGLELRRESLFQESAKAVSGIWRDRRFGPIATLQAPRRA